MDETDRDFRCYSVRRLNPFLGTLQIVETSDSRAITGDGIDWEIQILAERPHDTWGAPAPVRQKRQFLRFGVWNQTNGLSRVPANPLLDLKKMFSEANRLVEILVRQAAQTPFPLRDRYEFWLLDDKAQMPLALLASTTNSDNRSAINVQNWICCIEGLVSPELNRKPANRPGPTNNNPNKSHLEAIVQQRAKRAVQRWFKRTADGRGKLLAAPGEKFASIRGEWPTEAFPPLLLTGCWDEPGVEAAVSDYHAWLSPYLLTLQNLQDELRTRLERQAVQRSIALAGCWRFYPKIIDRKLIDAARVAARLRQSHSG